jgi:hypothetical protein
MKIPRLAVLFSVCVLTLVEPADAATIKFVAGGDLQVAINAAARSC